MTFLGIGEALLTSIEAIRHLLEKRIILKSCKTFGVTCDGVQVILRAVTFFIDNAHSGIAAPADWLLMILRVLFLLASFLKDMRKITLQEKLKTIIYSNQLSD